MSFDKPVAKTSFIYSNGLSIPQNSSIGSSLTSQKIYYVNFKKTKKENVFENETVKH